MYLNFICYPISCTTLLKEYTKQESNSGKEKDREKIFKVIIRLLKRLEAISWERKALDESQDMSQAFKVIFITDSVCMVSE